MRTISVTEFKAKCLAIIDDVGRGGERVVVSKHGRPIVEVIRHVVPGDAPAQHTLRGSVRIVGDVETPAVPASEWESMRQ